VNTEITDKNDATALVGYDRDCSWCRAARQCSDQILTRRGFRFAPLQSPGVARQLGLDEREELRELRLLLPDGRTLGGADAVLEIARHIWWAWPLWLVSRFPGARPVFRAIYRRLAANRPGAGGACAIRGNRKQRRHAAFLELP